jgi:hypothetical protein
MKPATEIYHVIFESKYRHPDGHPMIYTYTLDLAYDIGNLSIVPIKIQIIKDRVVITFADGGSHSLGYNNSVEVFRRPVKKKEKIITEDNG